MGFFGPNGRGVYEEQGCEGDVDFVVGTFSKSVGTVGGFCVSNHPKFEAIRLACRPYIFTASLPPIGRRDRRDVDPQADARAQQARASVGKCPRSCTAG